jgi:hypothetical protein
MQGGNGPQLLLGVLAERIARGELDAGIVCGAEALRTVAALMKQGEAPGWPAPDGERRADEVVEEDRAASTEAEQAVGMIAPIMAYPLIENALRAARAAPRPSTCARSPAYGRASATWPRRSRRRGHMRRTRRTSSRRRRRRTAGSRCRTRSS